VDAFLVTAGVVAVAEIGDKSQFLVLALATKYRRPIPIVGGMLAATLLNHTLAAGAGLWLSALIGPGSVRWILGLSFVGIGIWALLPTADEEARVPAPRYGVFLTTLAAYFLLEMGDKTQIATIALAAKFGSPLAVIGGSTLGALLADVPVVILGAAAADKIQTRVFQKVGPCIFLVIGIGILLGFGPDR
jgi:putative Ca2+/H+ antiporter (TMEM165/GDT1 family)